MPDYSTITNFCNNIPNMKGNYLVFLIRKIVNWFLVMNQNSDSDADYDDLLQDPEALCILNLVFGTVLTWNINSLICVFIRG